MLIDTAMDTAAERFPQAPALKFAKAILSYEGLAEQSDRLGATLLAQGVRHGDRIGLYFNKSIESVISLYGVLKAGAIYVPLDPAAPPARTWAIIEQCGIDVVITHPPKARDLEVALQSGDGCRRLQCVIGADDSPSFASVMISWADVHRAGPLLRSKVDPDDLAYILFTSGSTGIPKGIMHSHKSGLAYANLAADVYEVRHGDRLSNHPPLHFDMSIFDYVSGLIRGACTIIIPEPYTKLPASLSKLIQDERLTHWYSVPFALTQLLQGGVLDQRDLSTLRWVIFAGEPFVAKHLHALMASLPTARFSNSYGPTETNQCTYHHIEMGDITDDRPPPIGQVWNGAEALVVDGDDREVKCGESGELLVSSPTMMAGYWRRPELDSKAFYVRRKTADVTELFYRTGDVVVDEGGGVFRFLGRQDRQIKLRGFRIELDEVEAATACHPAVDEVAAILIQGDDGHDLITAVLTLNAGFDSGISEEVKADAARRLPPYAVPEHVVVAPTLPRTATDKIDRRALRHLVRERRFDGKPKP